MTEVNNTDMDENSEIQIGKIGEKFFDAYCTKSDMIVSKSIEDEMGWDFIIEDNKRTDRYKNYARKPLNNPFFIQIKSRKESTEGNSISIKLSAAEKLSDRNCPSFLVVIIVSKETTGPEVKSMYIIHILDKVLDLIQKRCFEIRKEGKKHNQTNITLSYKEHGQEVDFKNKKLIDILYRYVDNTEKISKKSYVDEKKRQFDECGRDPNHPKIIKVSAKDVHIEKIDNFLFGRDPLEVNVLEEIETIYGNSFTTKYENTKQTIYVAPIFKNVEIKLYKPEYNITKTLIMDVYCSVLSPEKRRFLNDIYDIDFNIENKSIDVKFLLTNINNIKKIKDFLILRNYLFCNNLKVIWKENSRIIEKTTRIKNEKYSEIFTSAIEGITKIETFFDNFGDNYNFSTKEIIKKLKNISFIINLNELDRNQFRMNIKIESINIGTYIEENKTHNKINRTVDIVSFIDLGPTCLVYYLSGDNDDTKNKKDEILVDRLKIESMELIRNDTNLKEEFFQNCMDKSNANMFINLVTDS